MKALVFHEPGHIAVEDIADPKLEPGDALLRVGATGICYSDIRVYHGQKHARRGVVPGHEIAGTIAAAGSDATSVREGDRVAVYPIISCGHCDFCLSGRRHRCPERRTLGYDEHGGLAEYVLLPAALVSLGHALPVPAGLPIDRACLTEPVACVLNSLETCDVAPGRSALLIGAGPMGLLHVLLARHLGARPIIVSEPNDERRATARTLGADIVIDPRSDDLVTLAREHTDGLGCDAVIVTSGIGEVIEPAIAAARRQGVVSLFAGFPPETRVPFDPNSIHYSEVRLTGSQNASVEQYRRTLELLPKLPEVDAVTTHRFPLAEAAGAYDVRLQNAGLKSMVLVEG